MSRLHESSEISRDIRHVSNALINYYAAYVSSLLYPYDHPLVSDSLKNSFNCLQKAFQKRSHLHIDTSSGNVFVEGEALDSGIPVIKHFVSWMDTFGIKSISFSDKIARREFVAFHKLVATQKPDGDALPELMKERGIDNITVHTAAAPAEPVETVITGTMTEEDFRKNFLSTMFSSDSSLQQPPEDLESLRALLLGNAFDGKGKDVEISLIPIEAGVRPQGEWTAEEMRNAVYVDALLERDISEDEKRNIRTIPPSQMAHFLNASLFAATSDEILARVSEAYFGGGSGENADLAESARREFFRGLKPDIRPLFLRHCEPFFSTEGLADDREPMEIEHKPAHEYAFSADAGRQYELPPEPVEALPPPPVQTPYVPVRTIENIDFTFDFVAGGRTVVHDIELDADTAALFSEDRLSEFRDPAWLETRIPQLRALAAGSGSVASLLEECTDETIQETSFHALLDLLVSDTMDGEACQKMTGRLSSLVEAFTNKGALEKVLDVYNALRSLTLQGANSIHASVMSRSIFSTDKFNSELVEALRRHGRKKRDVAGKITVGLRSYLVPYLLDALSEEPDTSKRRFMIILLTSVSSDVLPHIAVRFRDSRWYVLRNLLYLLRECHGLSYAKDVKEFLDHEVPLVRLEALRTLLSFQDPAAERHAIQFLGSDHFPLQKGAVWLAGTYRIKNAVPHLIALLKEKDILGKKFHLKKMIVRALGRIGDKRALSNLLNLCRFSAVVHKEEYDRLKLDIFRTLHNYPFTMLGPLIDFGMQSPHKEIAAISKTLSKQYNQSVGRQR